MTDESLRATVRAAIAAQLPEDEPDTIPDWCCDTIINTVLEQLREKLGLVAPLYEFFPLLDQVTPAPSPELSCCIPAPDRSGRQCDKPRGHDGDHWTYGGHTLTWPQTAPSPEPQVRCKSTTDLQRCIKPAGHVGVHESFGGDVLWKDYPSPEPQERMTEQRTITLMCDSLKRVCDRDWSDETPLQIAAIAANGIFHRDNEIAALKKRLREAFEAGAKWVAQVDDPGRTWFSMERGFADFMEHQSPPAPPEAPSAPVEPERETSMADAAEMLWVVLANVSGGDWTKQSPEWQEYAARWRDYYFAALKSTPPQETAQGEESSGDQGADPVLRGSGVGLDDSRRVPADDVIGYEACWCDHGVKGRCRKPKGHDGECAPFPYEGEVATPPTSRDRIIRAGNDAIEALRVAGKPYDYDEDLVAAAREALTIAVERFRERSQHGPVSLANLVKELQAELSDGETP